MKVHFEEDSYEEPINGYEARLPFHWSWMEDWEICMYLVQFIQSIKSVKTPLNRILDAYVLMYYHFADF
jgi:hypothetical protein